MLCAERWQIIGDMLGGVISYFVKLIGLFNLKSISFYIQIY